MKIRNRLTLTFSLTTLGAVVFLGLLIYFFTERFHHQEFFVRLDERVQLTELIFLEKNEAVSQAVREKFLQRLDEEAEYAISLEQSGLDSLDRLFFPGLAKAIQQRGEVKFLVGNRQGVAKMYSPPSGKYAVVVTAVDVFGHTKLAFLKKILLFGGLLCVLLQIGVGWFSTRRALQPLEDKIHMASEISASSLNIRLEVKNPIDEIDELAIAFNRMLDRLQTYFEAQRNFVSNASHEIRNPLTTIIGEADLLLEKERPAEEYREALRIIATEAERLQLLTTQLLNLAKAESLGTLPDPENLFIDQCLLEVLEKFPAHRLRLNLAEIDTEPVVFANPHLLQTALTNLVENALKYSGEQSVRVAFAEKNGGYEIKIADQGIGISEADMKNIYQPLFRARNARNLRGHGIGLPLAKKVIELHRGQLLVESAGEYKGVTVTVFLPKKTHPH